MYKYKFRNISNIEEILLDSLGVDLLLPSSAQDCVEYFHNGDKMSINVSTGELIWEPIEPGSMWTSKLALRFHQWVGKGIIQYIDTQIK